MKILGLDLGTKTLGIAISDPYQILARSVETIRFEEDDYPDAIKKLEQFLTKETVEGIVLGLPKNMNGTIGSQGEKTLAFKALLEASISIPIYLWDERLTSKMAQAQMIDSNKNRKKRKQNIDQEAAKIILQSYLDSKK
ncbi:MAG: Holliday junction resolvase RuvX [Candidatus Izemoplasmataceae bacterium]|jgi:putative holliday junction resolvase